MKTKVVKGFIPDDIDIVHEIEAIVADGLIYQGSDDKVQEVEITIKCIGKPKVLK